MDAAMGLKETIDIKKIQRAGAKRRQKSGGKKQAPSAKKMPRSRAA